MRILIVDDHDGMRARIRELLATVWPTAELGEATTATSGSRMAVAHPWDLVIVDLRLGDGSGLGVVRNVALSRPDAAVIVLSALPREPYERAALQAGARAFVAKEDAAECLVPVMKGLLEAPG